MKKINLAFLFLSITALIACNKGGQEEPPAPKERQDEVEPSRAKEIAESLYPLNYHAGELIEVDFTETSEYFLEFDIVENGERRTYHRDSKTSITYSEAKGIYYVCNDMVEDDYIGHAEYWIDTNGFTPTEYTYINDNGTEYRFSKTGTIKELVDDVDHSLIIDRHNALVMTQGARYGELSEEEIADGWVIEESYYGSDNDLSVYVLENIKIELTNGMLGDDGPMTGSITYNTLVDIKDNFPIKAIDERVVNLDFDESDDKTYSRDYTIMEYKLGSSAIPDFDKSLFPEGYPF